MMENHCQHGLSYFYEKTQSRLCLLIVKHRLLKLNRQHTVLAKYKVAPDRCLSTLRNGEATGA